MVKDWIVEAVEFSTDARKFGWRRVHYPFFVRGRNLSEGGKPFGWQVPSLDNARYDWSEAAIADESSRGESLTIAVADSRSAGMIPLPIVTAEQQGFKVEFIH